MKGPVTRARAVNVESAERPAKQEMILDDRQGQQKIKLTRRFLLNFILDKVFKLRSLKFKSKKNC